jgi:hypothetical protein
MSETENQVVQTPDRFELHIGDQTAFIEYRMMHGVIVMTHTEVPQQLEGQGIGSRLVKGALEIVRASDKQILPSCPFVASYIKRHPDYEPLVFRME